MMSKPLHRSAKIRTDAGDDLRMDYAGSAPPGSVMNPHRFTAERRRAQVRRLASILSQIIAATSGPPRFFTARMPVGEVTLISVR
jgi:hypothetical protein